MSAASIAVKVAAAALSDENTRKKIGWLLAAVLSPIILAVVLICFLSAAAQHNVSTVELCCHGGAIPDTVTVEYRDCVTQMRASFSKLDAAVEEIKAAGFNPVHVFFAVAQDIDRKCCNMTYIQLSLLAVPAAVIWGDTLILECREQWLTAGYFLGPWADRFRWRRALHAVRELAAAPVAVPDEPEEPPAAPLPAPVPAPLDGPAGQLLFNF